MCGPSSATEYHGRQSHRVTQARTGTGSEARTSQGTGGTKSVVPCVELLCKRMLFVTKRGLESGVHVNRICACDGLMVTCLLVG